jgi:hypothetical protein
VEEEHACLGLRIMDRSLEWELGSARSTVPVHVVHLLY